MFMVLCFVVAAILCFLLDRYFPEDRPLLLIIKYILTYWTYSLIAFGFLYIPSTHNPEVYIPIAIAFLIAGTAVGIYKSVHEFETFDSPPKSGRSPKRNLLKDAWNNKGKLIIIANVVFAILVSSGLLHQYKEDLIYCAKPELDFDLEYVDRKRAQRPTVPPAPPAKPKEYKPRCNAEERLTNNIEEAVDGVAIIFAAEAAIFGLLKLLFLMGRKVNQHRNQSRDEALAKYISLKDAHHKDPDDVKLMMIEKLIEKHPWLIDVEAEKNNDS